MIDLYTASTGNGRRAIIALEECGLAYRVHKLDLTKGEAKTPEFLKINPAAAIPAIVDADGPGGKPINIAQSGAIVLYCAEKSGKLIPKDPARRAEAYQWFMQAATDVAPTSSNIFYISTHVPVKDPGNTAYFEQKLLTMLGVVDKQLQGRDYIAGEISIADIAASRPLLPSFVPARSIACSIESAVMTPNIHGTSESSATLATPFAATPAT